MKIVPHCQFFKIFLDDTSLLDPSQSSFQIALTDDFHHNLDWGGSMLLILQDLSALYDMVNYPLLAHQLTNAGIQGTVLQWMISFLHGWRQRAAPEERTSPWCAISLKGQLPPQNFVISTYISSPNWSRDLG